MAYTDLTIVRPSATVNAPFTACAAAGNQWLNSGKERILIINDDAASKTVTFNRPVACSHGLTGNTAIVCPANERRLVGPFKQEEWNLQTGADAGKVTIDYSAVTNLKIVALGDM